MSVPFNPDEGLIIVRAEITGPSGNGVLRLALDTGATGTVINTGMLISVGYDPALSPERFQITTGSGVEFVPRVTVNTMTALRQTMADLPVLCHTLPPSTGVDGILGLDFFRGKALTIDFGSGMIVLC